MSLYYGYDDELEDIIIPRSNDFSHTFTFGALSTSIWVVPVDIKSGHPTPIPYVGKHITEDTNIELINYTLDKDGTITDLVVNFQLIVFEKGGNTFSYDFGDHDYTANRFPFTTRNISSIDKTYKLLEYHANYKDIAFIYIKVKKISGTESGNESALTTRVRY